MAPFFSDDELQQRAGVEVVGYVRELRQQSETHKARADAAVINAEQTCALIEQKFLSLTAQFAQLEHEKHQSITTLERRSGELAQAQSHIHKLELDIIKHEGDQERVSFELSEARKSKRELLDVVDRKNAELDEKNSSIKSYLEKIVSLTDERSILEGKLREHEAQVGRSHAVQARIQQEKELLEQHNTWLNEELNSKVKALMEERRTSADLEADLQSKLLQSERSSKEAKEALQRSNEHAGDLEAKLAQVREELRFTKEQSVIQEDHLSTEIATATKLADLYKQSSDEWSNKSSELEGVIKALETHLNQVEADYREKLEKEIQARDAAEKEAAQMKEKMDKALADIQTDSGRDGGFLALPAPPENMVSESMNRQLALELHGDGAILPYIGKAVSGTALAATLLRDGWSLSTMYTKYQEAVDAWRHERHERRHGQSLLERVLHEIELKAETIWDERAEHERMVEAYSVMEKKLHYSMADQSTLENSIKDLKVDLRKKERELKGAHKEISDLQIQVASLLKECAEVKQRYEAGDWHPNGDALPYYATSEPDSSAADIVISDRLVTFKDIRGMVEQNSQMRLLLRNLAEEREQKESELKEFYSAELKKRSDDAARKVAETLKKYKEKTDINEALQGSVAMYKRLYDEGLKSRYPTTTLLTRETDLMIPEDGSKDYSRVIRASQEELRTVREEAATRIKALEEDLSKTRMDLTNTRVERARADAEAALARDQMISLKREAENQRREMDGVLARNIEFSQTITDYQQRLRESAQKMQSTEELAHKLRIEASVLEREKELLASAEKRASEEVATLSDRAHRLQASLDTLQSVEEARENMRAGEMKKLQDDWSHMQREWAEGRKELEQERSHSRDLTILRDKAVQEAMDRVEALGKELADALKAMSAAETRAQVAEVRCTELEASLKKSDEKIMIALTGGKRTDIGDKSSIEIDSEILANLQAAREELEQVKEDLLASNGHTEQYKRIAEANEEALKQLEIVHNQYKADVEHMKDVMEADIKRLNEKVTALEAEMAEKETSSIGKAVEKEAALDDARKEIATLQESLSSYKSALQAAEEKSKTLKLEVDKNHHQWREAQHNYERQIVLQAATINELTMASEKVAKLEEEQGSLLRRAEMAETQLASFQVAWAMEKSSLEAAKVDTEKKWRELDEQNRLLLDRLEAMHITAAEHTRKESEEPGDSQSAADKEETDLQNVIRYLRRSKETAETEVSLLKQERLRMQRQLDAALHAAEEAQATLRREQESARTNLFSEEELKSLQAQVRELNLLRESNAQLREENRRNFEDSRESRERVRQAQSELEPVQKNLREKEVELEAAGKELEVQKAETRRWQTRVTQLLEKYKAIDVEDYQRVRNELMEVQGQLKLNVGELEAVKKQAEIATKEYEATRDKVEGLQNEVTEKDSMVNDLLKKLQDLESSGKAELDRFKRHAAFVKRKIETVTKEKDDISKENEALSKQVEELKANAGKRISVEARQEVVRQEATLRQEAAARQEQAQKESESLLREKETTLKERESRIQILEKTLERERESVRKERMLRQRDQKTFMDLTQKAALEKKRIESELEALKRDKVQINELQMVSAGPSEPSLKPEIEEKAPSFEIPVNAVVEIATIGKEPVIQPNATFPTSTASELASTTAGATNDSTPQPPPVDPTFRVTEASGAEGTLNTITSVPSGGLPLASSAVTGNTMGVAVTGSSTGMAITGSTTSGLRQAIRPNLSNVPLPAVRAPFRLPLTQVPVPDQREKEILQLRAQIQEKEKSQAIASVSQARKTARRLIRPRIEPAGQQEAVSESGDGTGEGSVDVLEGDMDTIEEGKLPAVGNDVPESVSTLTAGSQSVAVTTPAVDSVSPPSVSVNVGAISSMPLSSVRKRPALTPEINSIEEINLEQQDVKVETAPPQKRSRAVDVAPDTFNQESGPSSTLVVGLKVQGESTSQDIFQDAQEGQDGSELQEQAQIVGVPPEDSSALATIQESVTGVISLPDVERERPVAETYDAPPQKKPRFLKAISVTQQASVLHEELPEGGGVDGMRIDESTQPHQDSDETSEVKAMDILLGDIGNTATESVDIADLNDPPRANDIVLEEETQPGLVLQSLLGDTGPDAQIGVATTGSPLETGLSSLGGLDFDVNEPFIEIPNLDDDARALSTQVAFETGGMEVSEVTETEALAGDSENQRASSVYIETHITEEVQEGTELEEGEMPAEVTVIQSETVIADCVEGTVEQEKPVTEKDDRIFQEAATPIFNEQNVGAMLPGEHRETLPLPVLNESRSGISLEPTGEVAGSVEVVSKEERPSDEQSVEGTSMVTRQSTKSTTIHLAERARERAVLRRGGLNPPSPAARGRGRTSRGAKRAPGAARGGGRVISTGVRGRGQAGGSTVVSGSEASRSGTQAGSGPTGQADPPQVNPTSNPNDSQPREGED